MNTLVWRFHVLRLRNWKELKINFFNPISLGNLLTKNGIGTDWHTIRNIRFENTDILIVEKLLREKIQKIENENDNKNGEEKQ